MKSKKNIPVLLIVLAISVISAFNVQKAVNLSNNFDSVCIANIFTLTDASAFNIVPPEDGPCTKSTLCDSGNGHNYSTLTSGEDITCCGAASFNSGHKPK